MNKTKYTGALGLIILLASFILLYAGIIHWYGLFAIGGLLLFGSINYLRKQDGLFTILKLNKKRFLKLYFVYALFGLAVEIVRVIPDLWDYVDIYNNPALLPIFIFIVYPIFFSFILESYILIHSFVRKKLFSIIITFIFVFAWNEIANLLLVQLWIPNPKFSDIIPIIYVVGYVFEILIPVYIYQITKK